MSSSPSRRSGRCRTAHAHTATGAARIRSRHGDQGVGDIGCRRRRTVLVIDDAHFRPRLPQPQHRAHKVLAMRTIDPRGPDDGMTRRRCPHRVLTGGLAGAIGAQWIDRVALAVGAARRLAVEHIVGRNMDQRQSRPRAGLRNMRGAVTIDRKGKLRLALRPIDGGIGGRVDDQIGATRRHDALDRAGVRDIGLGPADSPHGPVGRESAASRSAVATCPLWPNTKIRRWSARRCFDSLHYDATTSSRRDSSAAPNETFGPQDIFSANIGSFEPVWSHFISTVRSCWSSC